MRSANFKPYDLISILFFLHKFMTACDRNNIHKNGAMRHFQHFVKNPSKGTVAQRVCVTKKDNRKWNGKLTIYCQVVSFLLGIYATDDVISAVEAYIASFNQMKEKFVARYSETLREKVLCYLRVYEETMLKREYIEGLQDPLVFSWEQTGCTHRFNSA